MIRLGNIAAVLLVVATSAHGQSLFERAGVNALFGISPSTQDFVTQVVVSEMFEIELSKLAEQRGNEKMKLFASQLLKDHKQTSAQLKALVRGGAVKVSYPTALDSARQMQLDKLKNAGRSRIRQAIRSCSDRPARGNDITVRTIWQRRRSSRPQDIFL